MYVPGATLAAQPVPTPFQSGGPPPPSNPLSIADIIPISQSFFDIFRNSEPSIAVNPMNPMQMVAAAFGAANSGNGAPFFFSTNGGTTWSLFGTLNHGDTSLAWSLDGSKVLATTLTSTGDPDSGSTINTFSSTVANRISGTRSTRSLRPVLPEALISPGLRPAPPITFMSGTTRPRLLQYRGKRHRSSSRRTVVILMGRRSR